MTDKQQYMTKLDRSTAQNFPAQFKGQFKVLEVREMIRQVSLWTLQLYHSVESMLIRTSSKQQKQIAKIEVYPSDGKKKVVS